MKRCRYCGEILVIEPGPHRAYREKRAQYCNRDCYKLCLMACPPRGKREREPTQEEIDGYERRKAECRERGLAGLVYAGED